jgi:dihydrofolate reductase
LRKVVFGGANSLDNYFAREDGAVDWLIWSDEAAQIMNDFWPRFDTIIMGRKTYEQAMKNAPPDASDVYNGMMTYVFSRTLPSEKKPGLEITDQDPAEFLRSVRSGYLRNGWRRPCKNFF